MRTAAEVSSDKLRGGFYTPPGMVRLALDRAFEQVAPDRSDLALLEPSAGDGAFLRGLDGHPAGDRVASVLAVELDPREAASCGAQAGDFLEIALELEPRFDVLVGNPPYIRYQFLDAATKARAAEHAARTGVSLPGVSNLWVVIALAALSRVRAGGAFALVLPTEFLTGVSARAVREWLREHCDRLGIDLLPPHAFPGVLQQVAVVSGRIADAPDPVLDVEVVEHGAGAAASARWHHRVTSPLPNWTRLLLTAAQAAVLEALAAHPAFVPLGEVARFEVGIVTGANAYFTMSRADAERLRLREADLLPLLPRMLHAPGLVYGQQEHAALASSPASSLLLALDAGTEIDAPLAEYLARGVADGLPERYKCRTRTPWYAVPSVRAGSMMLSKRVHQFPRVVCNHAGAMTTDTIYRGEVRAGARVDATPEDVAAGFHNSLTLLTAEVEGRSFGGGVLELVPSEIARLRVPRAALGGHLGWLDELARDGRDLVGATDELLVAHACVDPELLAVGRTALDALAARRHAR